MRAPRAAAIPDVTDASVRCDGSIVRMPEGFGTSYRLPLARVSTTPTSGRPPPVRLATNFAVNVASAFSDRSDGAPPEITYPGTTTLSLALLACARFTSRTIAAPACHDHPG